MSRPPHDPSIEQEPHLRGERFDLDPSEEKAQRNLEPKGAPNAETRAEHGVWDEPALSRELAEPSDRAWTYAKWLEDRRRATPTSTAWLVTAGVALAAGPWAVLGALLGGGKSLFGVIIVVVFAPAVEEVMKVGLALWVVEKRPFYFRSTAQLVLCGLASAAVFSAIENVMYLHLFIPDPSPGLVRWRWTVCMGMHVTCSCIASLGLARMWREGWKRMARPRASLVFPYLVGAALVHGTYNAIAVVLSATDYEF